MKKILSIIVAVMIAVVSVVPAFAYDMGGVSTPDFNQNMYNLYHGGFPYDVLIEQSGNTMLMMCDKKPVMEYVNGQLVLYNDTPYQMVVYYYNLRDGIWVSAGSSTFGAHSTIASSVTRYYWATFDLLNPDDDSYIVRGDTNFLQPSLEEEILGVTQETLEGETIPEVNRVMMVLTTLGVGCLALLIVLNLFGKRSLIFRH